MSDPSNLATREDAARIFGVSLRELSELIGSGKLNWTVSDADKTFLVVMPEDPEKFMAEIRGPKLLRVVEAARKHDAPTSRKPLASVSDEFYWSQPK